MYNKDFIKKLFESRSLNNVPTLDILDRLDKYKKIDLKKISQKKLNELTLDTIPECIIHNKTYKEGTKFYRVREYCGKEFTNLSELLYVPSKLVTKRGRINNIGESILYVSLDKVTPFFEVKAEEGKAYCLISYEICENEKIQVSKIGNNTIDSSMKLNKQGEINFKIIDQFFNTEFTKEVGKGTEYLYRVSTTIAKNFFDVPNSDGYEYSSVALNRNSNLAIKPKSVDKKLKVIGAENIIIKKMEEDKIEFIRISSLKNILDDGVLIYENFYK